MEIIEKIKAARLEKGYKQEYVAKKLGVATINYSKIERGITQLTIEKLKAIADILELDFQIILGKNENADQNKIADLEKENEALKRQLEDLIKLKQYILKDVMGMKSILINWMKEVHITEYKKNDDMIVRNVKYEFDLSDSFLDKESDILASYIENEFLTLEETENYFDGEIYTPLINQVKEKLSK
ncbi:MAG: helix-turn-helix domain-containing protein [Mangrovibacterium sp.]